MGYAVAGVIVIIAGVLAWLSFSSWRWFNVALMFLIVCAASVFAYLTGYTLKVHTAWQSLAIKQQKDIDKAAEERQKTIEGVKNEQGVLKGGIRQNSLEVQDLVVRRGLAWFDAEVARKPGPDGAAELKLENPEPHGLAAGTVVYAFDAESISDGGHYLGEFVVTDAPADGKVVKIAPNMPMSPQELQQLAAAKATWTLYEKMPNDENNVFKSLTPQQAALVLPDKLADNYREGSRDEKEMSDYVYLFHYFNLHRQLIADTVAKINSNIARLVDAENRNQAKIKYREKEIADLKFDKEGFETERDSVTDYHKTLDVAAKKLATQVAASKAQNAALAAQLKQLQLEAAQRINRMLETAQAKQ
jgi:hypothetical protein